MRLGRVLAAVLIAAGVGAVAGIVGPSVDAPDAGAARDPWRRLLARVPASGTFANFVIINDYAAARAAADLERDPDRIHDLLVLEKATGVAPSPLVAAPSPGDPLADELGISARGIKRDVVAGNPPGQLTILEGSIDPDRDLVAVADTLQAGGGYAGFLAAHEVASGVATGGPTPLAPYDAIAIGPSLEDADTPVLVVALAYPDATTARTQAERLRALAEKGTSATGIRWSELVTIDDITTEGRVVVGRFRTEKPRLWLDIVLRRDSLLASG